MSKKTKKKAKRKKAKRRKRRIIDPHKLLLEKIDRIRMRVPSIEPTGINTDPDTGEELFRFTEAQHVFKVYREQCEIENLYYRPYMDENIRPQAIAVGNMPCLIAPFCIEDLDTGARIVGYGCGMGANRDWSANTAHTRALKQFLLTTFEASWQDPEQAKNEYIQMLDKIPIEKLREVIQRAAAQEELGNHYNNVAGKGKKDAKRTRKKRNTGR